MKRTNNSGLKTIVSTQVYCPVSDVKDGIIITKDGRFVKILEFTPINFLLRSVDEQAAIISSFAALLRVMPIRYQFKVVTRKAEVGKFISYIQQDMKTEENHNCRVLQKEQIDLIRRIGSEQGVTRRFFLIFEYEKDQTFKMEKPTFADIAAAMHTIKSRICNMLRVCGNELVQEDDDEDETQLRYLYMIYARGESEKTSFKDRAMNVMMDYLTENPDTDTEDEIYLPVSNLIAPESINTKVSPRYMVVDDVYYSFCYVPGNAYPMQTVGGWLSILINAGEGIDVDLFARKEPVATVQRKLRYAIRYNKVKQRDTEDTSADYDDLADAISSGYYLKQGLANGDDFLNFGILVTITAQSKDGLDWKVGEMKAYLTSVDLSLKTCTYRQEQAFRSSLPLCAWDEDLFKKMKRNILSSSLAAAYPFVSFEMNDENGILFGINKANSSLIFVDNFDSKKYKNANIAILGTSGAGKTYALQCMALRMRERKIQTFIIAPDKGHEFKRACDAIGGQYIKISADSGQNINVMDIRKENTETSELLDGKINAKGSILAKKVQQLLVFFSLLIPDLTHEEKQTLDEALIRTYAKYGITAKNRSLLDPNDPTKYRKMPVLGDLQQELKTDGLKANRLYHILTRYVSGSAKTFNLPTNVDLDNKYVVLDVADLTEDLLPVGMFVALDYIWDKVREDRTQRKIVFIDELWTLIGAKSSVEAAKFVLQIFKVIRGYGGAAVAATQDINDFFALEDGKYGKGIISNSKTKIIMNLEAEECAAVTRVLDLTNAEIQQISRFGRGEALLVANTNHVTLEFRASASEDMLITTDRKQLAEIAARKRAIIENTPS